jgi:hypothetical protein
MTSEIDMRECVVAGEQQQVLVHGQKQAKALQKG